ncbi:hypothetical protein HDU85_002161 [Gaertneriomyces sp. JEL0708]|nr:hypothetical protein HDU85_002161 [Gaertneriomyces sp. JEL0708]
MCRKLESENQKLREECDSTKATNARLAQVTPKEWQENVERVNIFIRENNALIEKNKDLQSEIERLQDELERQKRHLADTQEQMQEAQEQIRGLHAELNEWQDRKLQADRELKMCMDDLTATCLEKDGLQSEVKRHIVENKNAHAKIAELKRSLEEITTRYQGHVRETQALAARERELFDNFKTVELERDEFKSKFANVTSEYQTLLEEHTELLSISQGLEKRISQLEEKEVHMYKDMAAQNEKTEEARLELDKSLIREQQAQAEVQRINAKMMEVSQKYRERADNEVATMRMQFQLESRQLNEEITNLETKCMHLQNQADRAIRDKRSAETELEKVTRHLPEEADRIGMMLEELNTRLRASERERNDALHKVESLHQRLVREENQFEKDKQLMAERSQEAYTRLRRAERELEEAKEDRTKLLTRMSELEHAHRKLGDMKHKADTQHEAELTSTVKKYEDQIKEMSQKLENVTEAHSRTCRDVQQLLSEHKRVSDKSKHEAAQAAAHYEHQVEELRLQVSRGTARTDDLNAQLVSAETRRKELLASLMEEKRAHARLQSRCQSAEAKAETLARQLATISSREMELGEEKRRLQRDLDRLQLDRERLERDYAFKLRNETSRNPARLRASLRSIENERFDDEQSIVDDTTKEVRELKAEIDRVKQRSKALGKSGVTAFSLDIAAGEDDEFSD